MNKQSKKGFTLVELLVVIAILAILGTVSIVGYTSFTTKAKNSVAEQETTQVKTLLLADWLDGTVEYSDVENYAKLATAPDDFASATSGYYTYDESKKLYTEITSTQTFAANKYFKKESLSGSFSVVKNSDAYYIQKTNSKSIELAKKYIIDILLDNEVDMTESSITFYGSKEQTLNGGTEKYYKVTDIEFEASNKVKAVWNIKDDSVTAAAKVTGSDMFAA